MACRLRDISRCFVVVVVCSISTARGRIALSVCTSVFFLFVVCTFFFFFSFSFFFQAEDGIRDLVRSRGLGDVYKRQIPGFEAFGQLFKRYQIFNPRERDLKNAVAVGKV